MIEHFSMSESEPTRDGPATSPRRTTSSHLFPFKEDGIEQGWCNAHSRRERSRSSELLRVALRSGCYFCFFQQKGEWVRLADRHPDLFEKAKKYEKEEQGYTWRGTKA